MDLKRLSIDQQRNMFVESSNDGIAVTTERQHYEFGILINENDFLATPRVRCGWKKADKHGRPNRWIGYN